QAPSLAGLDSKLGVGIAGPRGTLYLRDPKGGSPRDHHCGDAGERVRRAGSKRCCPAVARAGGRPCAPGGRGLAETDPSAVAVLLLGRGSAPATERGVECPGDLPAASDPDLVERAAVAKAKLDDQGFVLGHHYQPDEVTHL